MKTLSATAMATIAVILLCALSTGGQQQSEKGQQQTPGFIPVAPKRKVPAKRATPPGFIPGTIYPAAHLPDGRVVVFPARWDERGNPVSASQEEIDALVQRIAEGAVELPPGTKVIGWEPVEGATSLLPGYEQRVGTIPTTKGKLEALANAAGILQARIDSRDNLTNQRIDLTFSRIVALEKHDDELTNVVNVNAAVAGNADSKLLMLTNQLDDLKREAEKLKQELGDLKAVACSALYPADVSWATRMKIKSACGLL
jgi:hypothetical protein